jgi:hypothetical protein
MKTSILLKAICSLVVLGVFSMATLTSAQEADASKYIGAKKCKICHKKEDKGNQWQKWLDGPHSKAYEQLGSEEAKKIAAELGIDDPQASGKCLKCHATAYNWTETLQAENVPLEDGVGCESCHGPGADYKKKSIMQDREASIAAGLVIPTAETCKKCHNEENPAIDKEKYTLSDGTKTHFDFEQAYEKVKHPRPDK